MAKKAFTAVELMDGLHRSIFATTERGALPDVMTRALQKNFVDALITAAAESEGVKINKKLMDNHFLLDNQIPFAVVTSMLIVHWIQIVWVPAAN